MESVFLVPLFFLPLCLFPTSSQVPRHPLFFIISVSESLCLSHIMFVSLQPSISLHLLPLSLSLSNLMSILALFITPALSPSQYLPPWIFPSLQLNSFLYLFFPQLCHHPSSSLSSLYLCPALSSFHPSHSLPPSLFHHNYLCISIIASLPKCHYVSSSLSHCYYRYVILSLSWCHYIYLSVFPLLSC